MEKCIALGRKPPTCRKDELIMLYQGLKKCKKLDIKVEYENKTDSLEYTAVWADNSLHYRKHLKIHGWCTIPISNLNPSDIEEEFYSWLERQNDEFDRHDSTTYNKIPDNLHGIFKKDVGHTDFVWTVRKGCYSAFSELWKNDDLVCSFDGACFLSNRRGKPWVHCDASMQNTTYQGFYNIRRCGSKDGGLLLLENSHLIFDKYLKRHPADFIMGYSPIDFNDKYVKRCHPIKICCNAGELVIWDGRMLHCNTPTLKDGRLRMCVYVSMQPKELLTEGEIRKRREWYKKGKMTGHWCYGPLLKQNSYRTYGPQKKTVVEIAKADKLIKKLVG